MYAAVSLVCYCCAEAAHCRNDAIRLRRRFGGRHGLIVERFGWQLFALERGV